MHFIVKLLFLTLFLHCQALELEVVSDDDLVHLIKRHSYAVVLFSKKNCDKCDELEVKVSNLYDDFKEHLDAVTVKAFNSQLVRLYSPTKEPALVFFRHGIPMLYEGPTDEESIIHHFSENKDPTVRELNDETFEHLTQATSGSTTGDWFIMFYSPECVDCQRLGAVWESVGASLRNRGNVARINMATGGVKTATRFKVKKVPEFVFIRQGKYYKYEIRIYDSKSFIHFAQAGYVNASPHAIPVPESPFDNVVEMGVRALTYSVDNVRELVAKYPKVALGIASSFGLLILVLLLTVSMRSSKSDAAAKKEKTGKSSSSSGTAQPKVNKEKKKKAT